MAASPSSNGTDPLGSDLVAQGGGPVRLRAGPHRFSWEGEGTSYGCFGNHREKDRSKHRSARRDRPAGRHAGRHVADLEPRRGTRPVRPRGRHRSRERLALRAHRARLHARLRHHRADQLRPRRPVHALRRLQRDDARELAPSHLVVSQGLGRLRADARRRDALRCSTQRPGRAARLPTSAERAEARATHHRRRHLLHLPEHRHHLERLGAQVAIERPIAGRSSTSSASRSATPTSWSSS